MGRVSGVVLLAFALRVVNLTHESLWRDEVDSIRFALQPLGELLSTFNDVGFNGPLYHLALRGWFALVGVNDFTLRYFSVLFGVALVALSYVLGRRAFGAAAGYWSAWLTALSPVLAWYAGEGKMYSFQPALLALGLYALMRAAQTPGWKWWIAFVATTSASFYVHLLSPLALLVVLAVCAALWTHLRQQWRQAGLAFVALTLPYLPLAAWQLPAFLSGTGSILPRYAPEIALSTLINNWVFGLDPHAPLPLGASPEVVQLTRAGILALCLGGIAYGLWRWRCPLGFALLGWAALPPVTLVLLSLQVPLFLPRYVLWSAIAFYVLLAWGIAALRRPLKAVVIGLLSLVGVAGLVTQIAYPIRPDMRSAVSHILQYRQPGDAVVLLIPYAKHSFAYYAGQFGVHEHDMRLVEAPFTNYGDSPEQVHVRLNALLSSTERVWLFETESALWDARGLTVAWLEQSKQKTQQRDLHGVRVALYVSR